MKHWQRIWSVTFVGLFIMGLSSVCQAQLDESKLTWKPERGISLNGTTEFLQVTTVDDFNVDAITVETWVNLRDNSGRQQIAGRGAGGEYFTLYADNGNGRFLVENVDNGHESAITEIFPAGEWVHVAGVFDGAFVRLYYNGILVAETAWEAVTRYGEEPLMIGALEPGDRHLNGMLENLRIWNRALSEAEIAALLATQPADENIDQMKSDGLISYWSQRSVEDNTVNDLAGNNNAAKVTYTLDQSNLTFMPDGGISFDGQSTYVKIEDGTPFNLSAFSLEVWVKFDRMHENQVFMNRGGAPNLFTFYLYDRIRFLVEDVSGYSHANGPVPPANEWIHIVGVRTDDGTKRLYYNGILQHESSAPGQPLDSDAPLYLGALEPGSRHLDGQMENMKIWNKALTEEEILNLLKIKPEDEDIEAMKTNGLIAYWASRSVDGDQLIDLTGNGNDGTFGAFEIDESHLAFKPEQGIVFDGQTNYAVFDDPDLFEIDYITIEAWVNLTPVFHDRQMTNLGIVGRGGSGEEFSLFGGSQYGNRIHMFVPDAGDAAAPMPPAGQWVHLCGTYDMELMKLYYNGVLVDDVDAFGMLPWGGTPLYIGALSEDGALYEGAMENIRIWNRALSETEIQALLGTPPEEENISEMKDNGLMMYYTSRQMEEGVLTDISGNGRDATFHGAAGPVEVNHWSLY